MEKQMKTPQGEQKKTKKVNKRRSIKEIQRDLEIAKTTQASESVEEVTASQPLSQEVVSKKENGKKTFSVFTIISIAVMFGISAGFYLWMQAGEYSRKQQEAKALAESQAAYENTIALARERRIAGAEARIKNEDAMQNAWKQMWPQQIELTGENSTSFATIERCEISTEDASKVIIEGTMPGIPVSDSNDIYIFAMNTYETSLAEGAEPIISYRLEKTKHTDFSVTVNLNYKQANSRLFKKFVVAVKKNGKYEIISRSRYITNPEARAKYNVYTDYSSIKGLLVDPNKLNSGELEDLGVEQAAYNIPLGRIMGQTSSANHPTIYYDYNGRTYAFNGQSIAEYDIVFGSLSKKGINVTAILLNDRNGAYPEVIHPKARSGSSAPYMMFNGAEENGINAMAAAATFLAERYSGTGHGTISNWVIANEINARKEWNYMEHTDTYNYAKEYAQAFRVFYNAILSVNGQAKVYMPLDQTWNRNREHEGNYDARDILDSFNSIIKEKGNIDWRVAYHPYPVPLTNAAFWNTGAYYKKLTVDSPNTAMICMKNVHVVTDYLQREEFLMDDGGVRSVLLSEQGFTSSSGGEGVQAAAFAYAYYIAEANSHIDGFLLNRQTDAPEEVAQGLAFGLSYSGGGRKQIYNVFKYIDTSESQKYTEFAKGILGISDWTSVIHAH